MDGDATIS